MTSASENSKNVGRIVKRFSFAIISIILVFCFCEFLLFVFGFQYDLFRESQMWWPRATDSIIIADPHLFWRLRPAHNARLQNADEDYQVVNSLGFRDDEFPRQKEENEYRVIALGDSCTFGDGVARSETYAAILEDLLTRRMSGAKAQVVNAGVPGYSSYQALRYLGRELVDLAPDLVTVYVGFNDAIHASGAISDCRRRFGPIRIVAARLRFVQMMEYLIHKPFPAFIGLKQRPDNPGVFRVSKEEFIANLTEIHELGKNHGFEVLFMTLPHEGEKQPVRNAQIHEAHRLSRSHCINLFGIMKNIRHVEKSSILPTADTRTPSDTDVLPKPWTLRFAALLTKTCDSS